MFLGNEGFEGLRHVPGNSECNTCAEGQTHPREELRGYWAHTSSGSLYPAQARSEELRVAWLSDGVASSEPICNPSLSLKHSR